MSTDKIEQKALIQLVSAGVKVDEDLPEKNRRKTDFCGKEGRDNEFMSRFTPFRSSSIRDICEIRGQILLVPATPACSGKLRSPLFRQSVMLG